MVEQLNWSSQSDGIRVIHARMVDHEPGDGWALHSHDYIECFCVDAGSLLHHWEGEDLELVPDDVVALLPGAIHRGTAGSAGCRIINISCSLDALDWLRNRAGPNGTPWDGDRQQRQRVLGLQQRTMLRSVVGLVDSSQPMSRDLVLLALTQAVMPEGGKESLPTWLDRALRDHVDEGDLGGVQVLAQRCGMSREHLSRQVRRLAGCAVTDLLRQRRLQQAAARLRGTDEALGQIVHAVGFKSLSAFYAGFQQHYGMSPAAYRRQTHFITS